MMLRLVLMSVLLCGSACSKKPPSSGVATEQVSKTPHPSIPKALAERMQLAITLLEKGDFKEFMAKIANPKDLEKAMERNRLTLEQMLASFQAKAPAALEALKDVIQSPVQLDGNDARFTVSVRSDVAMPSTMRWSKDDGQWYLK